MKLNTLEEARRAWASHAPQHAKRGVILPGVTSYIPDGWKENFEMAMDAQPTMNTDPNSAVPAMLTTMIDPEVFRIIFTPNEAANIFGEQKKGSWVDQTAMFPVVEATGEVSSYGDFVSNGRAGANTNWPQRQSYLFQIVTEYGERELEMAGLAKINWVSELDQAVAISMDKYQNLTYFFGVRGLANYGLLNDPGLSAPLTPSTKAATGTKWINASGQVVATANEIFNDIQAVYIQLVNQTGGNVKANAKMTLALSPSREAALTQTNSFNVNVADLLKKNFPNLTVTSAVQYGAQTAANPQGVAAGEFLQLIVDQVKGQKSGYCAFNEKMRAHKIIPGLSSFSQKKTGGTWGAIVRAPICIASMLGI